MELKDFVASQNIKLYKTTPSLIADALRQAILEGVIQGGQVLRQEELATSFGVSRMPIREALHQLEAEGWLTIYPHRGAVVTSLNASEAQELYEIRLDLEISALKKAFPNITPQDLQKAQNIVEQLDREQNIARWGELNRDFHAALYAPANRPRLLALIENLHVSVDRYMRVELTTLDYQARSQTEHRQLLEACRTGDLDQALKLLSTHIENAGKHLVEYLKSETQQP